MRYIKLFEDFDLVSEDMRSTPYGLEKTGKIDVEALEAYYQAKLEDLEVYQDDDGLEYVIHDTANDQTFLVEWDPITKAVDKFGFTETGMETDGMKKAGVWSNVYGFLETLKSMVHH